MSSAVEKYMQSGDLIIETVADGRYSLRAIVVRTHAGLCIYLGGGELSHIGTVAISQPRTSLKADGNVSCTTSVINLIAHKDDALAIPLAEKLCKRLNQVITVTAGVHIDNAVPNDIDRFLGNLTTLGDSLVTKLLMPLE